MEVRLMFTMRDPFRLQPQERAGLEQVVRSTRVAAGVARRARVLLLLAEALSLWRIQPQTGMSPRRTLAWKRNWQKNGLDGLLDAPRAGRPRKLTPAREAALLAATEQRPPNLITHWSTRRLAQRLGLSHMTVMRVWHNVGLQPHRLRGYVASPDPDFEAKAKDVLGLYLDPPKNTAVFCVDERTHASAGSQPAPAAVASGPARAPPGGVCPPRHSFSVRGAGAVLASRFHFLMARMIFRRVAGFILLFLFPAGTHPMMQRQQ